MNCKIIDKNIIKFTNRAKGVYISGTMYIKQLIFRKTKTHGAKQYTMHML